MWPSTAYSCQDMKPELQSKPWLPAAPQPSPHPCCTEAKQEGPQPLRGTSPLCPAPPQCFGGDAGVLLPSLQHLFWSWGTWPKQPLCRAHGTPRNADPSPLVPTFFHCTVPAWGTAPHQPQAGDAPTPRASAASSISQVGSLMSHNKAVLATPPWRDGSSALHRAPPALSQRASGSSAPNMGIRRGPSACTLNLCPSPGMTFMAGLLLW